MLRNRRNYAAFSEVQAKWKKSGGCREGIRMKV